MNKNELLRRLPKIDEVLKEGSLIVLAEEKGSLLVTEAVRGVISDMRKSILYDNMLGYLVELIGDSEELVHTLKNIGFTDEEIRYELDR